MSQKTWNGSDGDWATAGNWTPVGEPGPGDDAVVAAGAANVDTDVGSVSTVENSATLSLDGSGALATTGDLTNTGNLSLDYGDTQGGARLTVGGTLDNNGGYAHLGIGNGDLSAAASVTAAALANSGSITLQGSANGQVALDVGGAAGFGTAGEITGSVSIGQDSEIAFASGGISSIAAQSGLTLVGSTARLVSGAAKADALMGLATNAGTLAVDDDSSVALTGDDTNTGTTLVDFIDTSGGARFSVAGRFTNSGQLTVGNGRLGLSDGGQTATVSLGSLDNTVGAATGSISVLGSLVGGPAESLDVGGAAGFGTAGEITGYVTIGDNADIAFDSGGITGIAAGSGLTLTGPTARIVSGAAQDDALAGLGTNAGRLTLDDAASVQIAGDLTNTGNISVDYVDTSAGATFSVAGRLTNSGQLTVGNSDLGKYDGGESATVSLGSLDNTVGATTGSISVSGNVNGGPAESLDVGGAAGFGPAGEITGYVSIGDNADIAFASGQITGIAAGSGLTLDGPTARIVSGAAQDNALAGLATNAGRLVLSDAANVQIAGDLDNTNVIVIDGSYGSGGGRIAIGGALTNSGTLQIGTTGLSTSAEVTAASLDNAGGEIDLAGGTAPTILDITGAAGVLTGNINLQDDALLEFGGGQVTGIGAGSELTLSGPNAFVADAGSTASSSALTGLASIAGTLSIDGGAVVQADGDLTVESTGTLDASGGGTATSALLVDGTLADDGTVTLSSGVSAQIGGLDNTQTLNLDGDVGVPTTLEDFGAASNSGTINIGGNAGLDVSGTLSDTGTIEVGGSLDVAQGLDVSGSGRLVLQGGAVVTPGTAATTVEANASASGYGTLALAVVDDGTLTAQGGTLDVAGAVTGTGSFAIANASELELGGTAAETVGFDGNVGTLKLDDPSAFTGDITGLVKGDTIDLAGVEATSVSLSGSTLTVEAGPQTYSYQVAGNTPADLAANSFELEDDGQGGTDIVLGPPGPSIRGPKAQTAFTGYPAVLGPLSVADPTAAGAELTATINDASGILSADAVGGGTVSGDDRDDITLTGTLAELDAELASLAYAGETAGTETVTVQVTDAGGLTASQQIAVATDDVPYTAPVLNAPASGIVVQGTPTAIGGISVSDPFAETTGQQFVLENTSNAGTFTTDGGSGAAVSGQGSSDQTITGTVQQINADIQDPDLFSSLAEAYTSVEKQTGLWYATLTPFQQGVVQSLTAAAISTVVGSAAAVGVVATKVLILAAINSYFENMGFVDLTSYSDQNFEFNAAGEFLLTQSTQPGDTFQVQVRLQPKQDSSSVSEMTQVAAMVGTDRVTVGLNRADPVWINGQAIALTPGSTVKLKGGQVQELPSGVYFIAWNTGEVLTIADNQTYLDVGVGLAGNDAPGSLIGLMGPDSGASNDFTLPDHSVLQQPLSASDLYKTFANAWRITQAQSLFDYGPGETTSSFTDASFPDAPLSLSDFPTEVVQNAASAVAALGVSNPAVLQDVEFDYIVSGGDLKVAQDEASTLSLSSIKTAPIAPNDPAPSVVGVLSDQQSVKQADGGPTSVTFDAYLTAAATTDTVVDYTVVSDNAGDLTAADFGGTLPSGSVTIAAGQTMAQLTIAVPQGALGTTAQKNVDVQITSPGGTPIVASSAKEAVYQPEPGPPPQPELSYLGNLGNFTQDGNDYTLDLGAIQFGEAVPELHFAIDNAAGATADQLTGTFTVPTVAGFDVSGASIPAAIVGGASYQGLTVGLVQNKFGGQSETITFDPADTNASGFTAPLSPITLTITDTLELPGMVYSQAWGDVHIISYNGLLTNFQGAGEFTLAKSNIAGDSFDIQMRLEPWYTGASVTTIQQAAISLGTDDVTFDWSRSDPVTVNGTAATFDTENPTLTLNGGTVTEVSPSVYKVTWNTGETATFSNGGGYINIVDGILGNVGPGAYSGLQGEDEGTSNDVQLADGTVLQQPVSSAELYGEYANSWRVSQATSLFDYLPGQSTATFTDTNYPNDPITLGDLPTSVVADAAAKAAAAGITDPGIAQAAELDYLATGDPSFIASAQNIQQFVLDTTPTTVTPSSTPAPAIGVEADAAAVTESSDAETPVTFTAYLTGTESTDTTVDYGVVAPDAGDLGAGAFVGTLPSGAVTIAAGQTSAQFTIDVPEGALGATPSADLVVEVSSPGNVPLFAPTAQTEVVNATPEKGAAAVPELAYLGQDGTFSFDASSNTYTLDLGDVTQGAGVLAEQFAVINAATGQADSLGGTFSAPTGTGFTITGDDLPNALAAGALYEGLYASVKTAQLGSGGMTLVFTPTDVNDSGYSATLALLTLKIVDDIVPPAQVRLDTPSTIIFPNVRVGSTADQQAISITNTAPAGGQSLDVTGTASASATVTGSITRLAAGATDAASLKVAVSTSAAGAHSGAVELIPESDDGAGGTTPLESPDTFIDVFGAAYRPGAPTVTLTTGASVVHVGDPGTASLTVANTDPADGYSENLVAALAGVTGDFTSQGRTTTGEIAAGASDSTSFKLGFSTAQAGVVTGDAIVGLTSDGGTGSGSIDGLGTLNLPNETVPVSVTVDNYAQAGLAETSGGGTFSDTPSGYTLDLGTIAQGSGPVTVDLAAQNTAGGAADLLAGSFGGAAATGFTDALTSVSGLGAGQSASAGTVTLSTATPGLFQETITFSPTGSNASGYSGALPTKTLVITGAVADETSPYVTVTSSETAVNAASPPATITFDFAEAVEGFDASDVTTTGGTLGPFMQSRTNPDIYTASFTPTAGFTGQGSVSVAAGSYTDLDGKPGSAGGTAIAEDLVPPSVSVSSDETSLDAGSPPATISFAFSEAVNDFDAADLTTTGGALGAFTRSQTNPDLYTAIFTPTAGFTGQGSVSVAAGSYTDLAGNPGSAGATVIAEDLSPPSVNITTPGGTVADPDQFIRGTGEAGTTIALFDDGASTPVATTQVASDGQWSAGLTLSNGNNTIFANDTDSAGNTGTSNTIDLVLARDAACSPPGSGTPGKPTSPPVDSITVNQNVAYHRGVFTITGTVSSTVGVKGVEFTTEIGGRGGPLVDLGAATVNPDGTFTFTDPVDRRLQGFITATETDDLGLQTKADFHPALQGGKHPHMDRYDVTPTQVIYTGSTYYRPDRSERVSVTAPEQTLTSAYDDVFANGGSPETTYVFEPGHGHDVVSLFRPDNVDHDTLSFKGADFDDDIATVLAHTTYRHGGAVITDPASGDMVKLVGVTKKELTTYAQQDIAFHA